MPNKYVPYGLPDGFSNILIQRKADLAEKNNVFVVKKKSLSCSACIEVFGCMNGYFLNISKAFV